MTAVRFAVLLFLAAVLGLAAIGLAAGPAAGPPSAAVPGLGFEPAAFSRSEGRCEDDDAPCVSVDADWPVALPEALPAAKAINAFLADDLAKSLAGAVDTETPATEVPAPGAAGLLAERLIDNYRQSRAEFPEAPASWSFDYQAAVRYAGPRVVTLATQVYSFLGGAHPLTVGRYVSFEAKSGRMLTWDDLAVDAAARAALTAAAEAAFRAARDLGPGDDLKAAGFWFEDGRFRLPDSFGLAPEGLLLRFDPYEVAPYALGETDFVVPRAALAGLVKDPGLLP